MSKPARKPAAAIVMGRLKEIREQGFTILILHHTIKSDDKIAKGSTGWYDLADHTLSVNRTKNPIRSMQNERRRAAPELFLTLKVGKKTRFEPFPQIDLRLDPINGEVRLADRAATPVIEAIAEYPEG